MHKIRYYLTAIMLLASLSGFVFLGSGLQAQAHMTSHHPASAFLFRGPCPGYGSNDC